MREERWDYDTTLKFIRLIHARPVIWKRSLQEFIEQYDREAAIADVAARMNTNPNKIKERLRRMKDNCYQEEIRMQTFNDYTPRWNYFHQFRFILKADHGNEIMKREIEEPTEPELDDIDEILWVDETDKKETLYDESDVLETAQVENADENAMNCNDEFTVLGENIASELRKLEKHVDLQTKLKNEITLAMLEAIENVAKQKVKK